MAGAYWPCPGEIIPCISGSIRVGEEFVRRRIVTLAACLLPMACGSEARAAACKPADPSLAGHYYLRGVMEVGSELLLHADGRFEYMLAYGALDELASGAGRGAEPRSRSTCASSRTAWTIR
jgi:hypothetical protein